MLPASNDRRAPDRYIPNPLTAPDWVVAIYADNYFAYDVYGRVIQETANGASRIFT